MGYASRLGKARISSTNPQAAAVCDRCGVIFNHVDLKWQFDFAGTGIINKRLLVCRKCDDVPQNQLKAVVLPPDPVPIINPRPFNFEVTRTDKRITIGPTIVDPITSIERRTGDQRTTQDDDDRIIQKNGDDMLAPKVVKKTRVTSAKDRRTTPEQDVRVTELMSPVPGPPLPTPVRPVVDATRQTMEGAARASMGNAVRDGLYRAPGEYLVKTFDGDMRTIETNVERGSAVYPEPSPYPAEPIIRTFKKRKKAEK